MEGSKIVFREYTSDASFAKITDIPKDGSEIQVVLTFARDYDGVGPNKGKFIPYWDTKIVNPEVIAKFKNNNPSAKVLVSIGGDKGDFPFKIDEDSMAEWIGAATESLTGIIKRYNLDGIDVYYEDIKVMSANFVQCIGKLIKELKIKKVITRASISPKNIKASKEFYLPLYQGFKDYIDNINLFPSVEENLTGNTKEDVLGSTLRQYPHTKLLLGNSGIHSPPIFFLVCKSLLSQKLINGISLKDPSYSIIANFPTQWILDFVQFPPVATRGSYANAVLKK